MIYFPRRGLLLARAADLNLRHGNPEDARKIVEYGLRVLPNSPVRLALVGLKDELPPEPLVSLSSAPAVPAPAPAVKDAPAKK